MANNAPSVSNHEIKSDLPEFEAELRDISFYGINKETLERLLHEKLRKVTKPEDILHFASSGNAIAVLE